MPFDFANFDFRSPDYESVVAERIERLLWVRENPQERVAGLAEHYRWHPDDFIHDWGCTFDPRNTGQPGKMAIMPFMLFEKQRDWIKWAMERWLNRQEGITEKSRDMGLSWLAVSLACTLCIFHTGLVFGFGSRKEEYVDKAGLPRSLFFKGRLFMDNLPEEFCAGWSRRGDAHMRMSFPQTGSVISGESGDNIGRGDRTSLYVTDEDAHLEHPDQVDAALAATTDCRLRISSANGTANSFYLKRQQYAGTKQLFTLHWRDNPLKDQEWYDGKAAEVNNPVIMAQEYDINYSASVEGVLIPSSWVQAAVDAHKKLNFGYDGARFGSLDVADQGKDKNVFCGAHGVVIERIEMWSGAGSDVAATVAKAFGYCDELQYTELRYDGDGMGAGCKGIARLLNEQRPGKSIKVEAWRGTGELWKPSQKIPGTDRTNSDFFANPKAQGYWDLRERFRKVYLAMQMLKDGATVEAVKAKYPPDELISLPSTLPHLSQITVELSQPTGAPNSAGKMVIDKTPDDMPSPNFADAIMMRFAPMRKAMAISDDVLKVLGIG